MIGVSFCHVRKNFVQTQSVTRILMMMVSITIIYIGDKCSYFHSGVNETLVQSAIKQVRRDYQPYGVDFDLVRINL